MSDRLAMLQQLQIDMNKYTKTDEWRPGLMDLWTFDSLISMYESDYADVQFQTYIWRKKPDEVMQYILDTNRIFDLEYGWDSFDEELREYLIKNDFIVDIDDVSDEELQANLEGK